jgi:hypothetical protein
MKFAEIDRGGGGKQGIETRERGTAGGEDLTTVDSPMVWRLLMNRLCAKGRYLSANTCGAAKGRLRAMGLVSHPCARPVCGASCSAVCQRQAG